MICRNCGGEQFDQLCDLGFQPLANTLSSDPAVQDALYPLAPLVCLGGHCGLVQLPALPPEAIFTADYPYRSGQSQDWLVHLAGQAALWENGSFLVEVGGNDSSLGAVLDLLQPETTYLNIDPTADPEDPRVLPVFMDRALGFTADLQADVVVANNVLAHVPNLESFVWGIWHTLVDGGLLVVEVQDVEQMINKGEWDCVYHEHYSYFSRGTLGDVLERRGFFVASIQEVPTHGGSLRAIASKIPGHVLSRPDYGIPLRKRIAVPTLSVHKDPYRKQFADWRISGKRVVGYGAPAKANTWLNYLSLTSEDIEYILDSTPEKIGKWTPGSHIPIRDARYAGLWHSLDDVPDVVVILAWNWAAEILEKIPPGPEVWARGERIR
jgi:hypothetical protein